MKLSLDKNSKTDFLIIIALIVVFLVVELIGLGNTTSPESFSDFSQTVAMIEFDTPCSPDYMMVFSGIRTGTYYFEFSDDGENYIQIAQHNQNYGEVLRWSKVSCTNNINVKYARIFASENPFLGEVVFFDKYGNRLSYSCNIPEICDEQDKVVDEYSFMNSTYFDEIYHARTALENIYGIWPYEISHPPLGKLIIALGITIFGMTPFGWRFSGAFFGVMMIPLIYIFVKRLFKNRAIALCSAIIFATDFMRYVQTRIATIDTYAVFFIILMYYFMYLFISTDKRSYLAWSGVFFGIGAACKWTCIYAGCGLAIIWLIYHLRYRDKFLKDIPFSVLFFILIPISIYYLSYIPYGKALNYTLLFSKDYAKMVWSNQEFMFSYHSKLVAEHPYSSKWYQWILNLRPILYYLKYYDNGTRSSFGAFMNPVLCLGGLAALILVLYDAITKREKIAIFIVIGYLSQLLPWVFITRLTFEYHYFPSGIFLTLSLAYIFNKLKDDKTFMVIVTALSVGMFIYFYPVLSGFPVDSSTKMYHWLKSWPF